MTERSTQDLIQELAADLRPVRRLPRLRVAAAGVLAAWLLGVVASVSLGGPALSLGVGDAASLVILAGLLIAGVAGPCAALAAAIPGRDAVVRRAGALLVAGLVLAVGGALALLLRAGVGTGAGGSSCASRAALLAIAPGLVALAFVARACVLRRAVEAWTLPLGCLALGAMAVHVSCVAGDPLHVLLGHVLAPVALAALLGFAFGAWLGRPAPTR